MVAASLYNTGCIVNPGHCIGKFNSPGAFYIFTFLTGKMDKNYKAKETMLVITVGFLVVFVLTGAKVWLYISLGIGIIGILSFYLSEKIDWFWGKLSYVLGEISNTILLTLIFIIVVTPVALIRKLRKKNELFSFDKKKNSYFFECDHPVEKKDFENTW
jgi:hypothetical protein